MSDESYGRDCQKVPQQILGGDAEKNDSTECATINDLIIMKGHEAPGNHALTILKGFSTIPEVILEKRHEDNTNPWRQVNLGVEDYRKIKKAEPSRLCLAFDN